MTLGRSASGDATFSNSLLLGRMVLPYETRARLESLGTRCGFFRNVRLMAVLEARSQAEKIASSMSWVAIRAIPTSRENKAKSEPALVDPKSEVRLASRRRLELNSSVWASYRL
jgi:hypothetical protein